MRKSVVFMKTSKRLEAKAAITHTLTKKTTKEKLGNNYLLAYEIN